MKIYSTHAHTVARLAILCGTAWMCLAAATSSHAQSGSDELSQAGGFTLPAGDLSGGAIQHGGESYRVVKDASYRTAADTDAKTAPAANIQQVDFLKHASGHCSSCGTSSCGGSCGTLQMQTSSCGTCGTSCGGTGGLCGMGLRGDPNRQSLLSCQGALNPNSPCEPCSPYRYASIEALYMQREDVGFSFPASGNTLGLPGFDFEWGPRIVIGAVYDCVNGYEASLVGPFEWDTSNQLAAVQTIGLELFPGVQAPNSAVVGTLLSNVTSETTVSDQAQSLTSEYFSIDTSKTINGWEVAKLLIGARYVDYDENYRYSGTQTNVLTRDPIAADDGGAPPTPFNTETTTSTTNQQLSSEVENQMIGLQVGMDLLYPIGRFAYSDVRMRAGAYANFAEVNFQRQGTQSTLSNPTVFGDITNFLNDQNSIDELELAGLFELGTGIRYQLGELLSVRAGVELWYLSGVATATQNVAAQGNAISVDDDVLFTGVSFGSELRW